MNREQLQDAYINEIIDGMDIKDMMALLFDMLDKEMDIYTDEELKEEVENYYPHLLEDWTKLNSSSLHFWLMPFFNAFGNTSSKEQSEEMPFFIPMSDWNRGTYRELLAILSEVPEQMLDQTVTIRDEENDEYYPAKSVGWTGPGCDTLGNQHMYVSI